MKFKVFFRLLFIGILSFAILFIVYDNFISKKTDQTVPNNSIPIISSISTADDNNNLTSSNKVDTNSQNINSSRNYKKDNIIIKISALGDVALGQDWSYNYTDSFDYVFKKQDSDYGYFFKNVVDILSGDDLTIANLETTLSNETQTAEKYDYGNNYWFNGRPEFANILKVSSIEIANLANNHTYDYGQKGYDATRNALKTADISYFGYSDVLIKDVKGIKVGMVGFNQLGNVEQGLDMNVFKREVADMTKKLRGECDLLIANFHWGKEYQYQYNALQKEIATLAIDSGADLIIGNHPHVLQPIVSYKGRYIIYSLGNFCFGGNKTPKDYDTAIYQQSFVFDSNNVLQPVKQPTIVPCSVSSQSSFNNYQPSIVTEQQISRVYSKLNLPKPEKDKSELANSDMVRASQYIDNMLIELRYASPNNILGKPVYESNVCYLRKGTAVKLAKANEILLKQGYMIKVWDGYRAQKYQQFLYDNAPNKSVFMNPKKGPSNHTRGAAVDCTLVTLDGKEVDMPSDFDDGSVLAYRTYEKCTKEQKQNALILENAMESCGFISYYKEWWHFDDSEYKNYKVLANYP